MQCEFSATLYWVKNSLESRDKQQYLQEWRAKFANPSDLLDRFSLLPDLSVMGRLPHLSFMLSVPFTLCKPYISKDDQIFYLLENPICREKVFQTPMVASTGWKGALRAAMVRELVAWWQGLDESQRQTEEFAQGRFGLVRLFGDEKGEEPDAIKGLAKYLDEAGGKEAADAYRRMACKHFGVKEEDPMPHFQGRLHFFPTFFDQISLEVINPHDRQTGAGSKRGPILMECVPQGARGDLFLLYVPFGPIEQVEEDRRAEVARDLRVLAEGLRAMLTKYGFGAKTSTDRTETRILA